MNEPNEIVVEAENEEDVGSGTDIVRHEQSRAVAIAQELSVEDLLAQIEKVRIVADKAMDEDIHYGKIPGTDKPTLLKPGAEKLQLVFRLAPRYRVTETWHDDGHLTVDVVAELYHVPTGNFMGEGVGLCSTKEEKYAYRTAKRACPACGAEQIIKGKEEYGGGWLCWKKQGGCGAKFTDDSPDGIALAKVEVGKVANEKLADTYNTVLKMAKKRAQVDAVLTATAAGDVFTQDLEDRKTASGEEPSSDAGPLAPTGGSSPEPAGALADRPAPAGSDLPTEPGEGDPEKAADVRVTRLKNLAAERGGYTDADLERIVSNHMAATGLGYLEKAWVEEQIKLLAAMPVKAAA